MIFFSQIYLNNEMFDGSDGCVEDIKWHAFVRNFILQKEASEPSCIN